MLYWYSHTVVAVASAAAIEKITFRAALAAICSFLLALVIGPVLIRWLKRRFREPIRSASPTVEKLHKHKESTPTMGGLFIVAGILGAALLFGDLTNPFLLVALLLLLGLAAIGAWDDLAKLRHGQGLRPRTKLLAKMAVAVVVSILAERLLSGVPGGHDLQLPFLGTTWRLGAAFVPFTVLVIVGSSNAVNLTDGLDGLAGGCLIFAFAATGAMVYVAGHAELAEYLRITKVSGAGEMTVLAAAAAGAVLGFLWFNCHPAQVFMGDTGSLPLGGLLGFLAVVARQELLLVIVCGVFVIEATSVILQVASFRWWRKRVFLCAPLHHHFQFLGWPENKIVVRFWIAAACCAVIGLASLKFSVNDAAGKDVHHAAVQNDANHE